MARMIPPHFVESCTSPGERHVFYKLRDERGTEDWLVLHSLNLAHHSRQVSGEIDFVIIIPQVGVLCLEVKACSSLRRREGLWYYGIEAKGDARGPFRQAAEAMHSLRSRLVKKHPQFAKTVFWSAVLFPYVSFEEDSPEWHPWQSIDRAKFRGKPLPELLIGVMRSAHTHLANCVTARWFDPHSNRPNESDCEAILNAFRGDFETFESAIAARNRRESEVNRFTEEQFGALDSMEANDRVIFAGPAGTGKTVLALEVARRSASAGKKTLLLCFNRNLGIALQKACKDMNGKVHARHLHGFMVDVVGNEKLPQQPSSEFWDTELPEMASLKLIDMDDQAASFDVLIVDEAQDILRDQYFEFLDILLKGGLRAGRWLMFGDFENQAIYGGQSIASIKNRLATAISVYALRTNCRNTPRVAAAARLLGGLNPDYNRVLRPDGGPASEPVYMFYGATISQQHVLAQALGQLYEDGFQGSEIVILSPFGSPRAAAASLCEGPWKNRIKPFSDASDGYIKYSTIHAFKGLESPAIVITDLERIQTQTEQSLLYVAVTRATDRLILVITEDAKSDFANIVFAQHRKGG